MEVAVTGIGITAAIGQGKADFGAALFRGGSCFDVLRRPGRQLPAVRSGTTRFLGAEVGDIKMPDSVDRREWQAASISGKAALATLHEAWQDAHLDELAPERIGLVVGGSNFQQRELVLMQEKYRDKPTFLKPSYGLSFWDTDLCGLCTQCFDIKGFAYTLGNASASGQAAVIQAIQAVRSGQVDACIALGALMDLSYWECQALQSMGAMGSHRFADEPDRASRPFDADRDGFIFGETCGAVVIQAADKSVPDGVKMPARLTGWAINMDGNRNPNPSLEGEVKVLQEAMSAGGVSASEIDYINPHGTGSEIGDEIELRALAHCGLNHAYINTTKSITGHGLTAAGVVELIAVLIQINAGRLHPSRNLEQPISPDHNWVKGQPIDHAITNALNISLGFGGVNTAILVQRN